MLVVTAATPRDASATPTGATGAAVTLVADGVREPHTLRTAPDGRLFLLQQAGKVRIITRNRMLNAPALTIDPNQIVEHNNSAGLLGIAFPPGFASAAVQHVYLLYTHEPMPGYPNRHNVVSRWVIDGNTIDPASEQVLVHLDPLVDAAGAFATSHYGGDMEFGNDGKLYVSTGDLYRAENGQSMSTLHGKILRYNPDGSIPSGNPYVGQLSGRLQAIWSTGLRNPFKLTLDRRNGRMVIGDVGNTKFEEVNVLPPRTPGLNFGWSAVEGYTTDPAYQSPALAYPHESSTGELAGCAVMGGDMYRPRNTVFPALKGDYLFADFCQGWVRSLDIKSGTVGAVVASGFHAPVDIAVTRNGAIWVAERQLADGVPGGVFRIDPQATGAGPTITGQPQDVSVASGATAGFTVYASGIAPLSYQWYRNDVAIAGATASTLSVAGVTSADSGSLFKVRITDSGGTIWSRSAALTVSTNQSPTASITSPAAGALFSAGDVLQIAGTGSDAEDGALPASAFTWAVDLHHNTHVHELVGPVTGVRNLSVPLSRTIETATDIFYRVRLTVKDSRGATTVVTRDVQPRLTSFTLDTMPSGLPLLVDGVSASTPASVGSVVGATRSVGATSVTRSGVAWAFDSWRGGSTVATNVFNAPTSVSSYTAFFRPASGSIGTGTGLRATYYRNTSLTDLAVSRVDRVPYFSWPTEPVAGVQKDDWGARWRGDLQAQFSGTTQFWATVRRDETLTVKVGGQTVIDASTTNGSVSGSVTLVAGQRYPIEITFTDGNGSAALDLTYGPDQARRSVLAGSQLYPAP
ncbi:MAG: PQQ-dependent sugar dehydrogenase [Actinomycetes bacterium]